MTGEVINKMNCGHASLTQRGPDPLHVILYMPVLQSEMSLVYFIDLVYTIFIFNYLKNNPDSLFKNGEGCTPYVFCTWVIVCQKHVCIVMVFFVFAITYGFLFVCLL